MKKLIPKLAARAIAKLGYAFCSLSTYFARQVDYTAPHLTPSKFFWHLSGAAFQSCQWCWQKSRIINDKYQLPYWQKIDYEQH